MGSNGVLKRKDVKKYINKFIECFCKKQPNQTTGWRSFAKHGLPLDGQFCVISGGGHYQYAGYYRASNMDFICNGVSRSDYATYWMALPDPKKIKELE